MKNKAVIETQQAPSAIGPYSQAIKVGNTVYLSGQIPLDPDTGEVVDGDFATQAKQVLNNLAAVCEAAGGNLSGLVKLTIYLTDLKDFPVINQLMEQQFTQPYPARATVGVSQLPKGVAIEIDGIMAL